MLDKDRADDYFSCHLKKTEWFAKVSDDRKAALSMAEQDVSLELGMEVPDYDNPIALAAVCEQALFLLLAPDEAINPTAAMLSAESMEGIGSRTFRNSKNTGIAPRAQRFIDLMRGRPGIVRTSRG